MRGIINIVIGIAFIIGGLSGKLVMRGTSSGEALAVVGGFFIFLGLYRIVRSS